MKRDPKTIFLLINRSFAIRNILRSGTLEGLKKSGHKIIVFFVEADVPQYLKTEFVSSWQWNLGYIYGIAGEKEKALEILNYYLELSKNEFVWTAGIAVIYIGLDEKDKAFEWLEKTYEQREGWMTSLKVEPMFDSLRSDPRFQGRGQLRI